MIGKIQIVKSFIIPKFLSKAALISVPEDHVKEIKKLTYHFSQKGKHLLEEDILTVGDLFFRRVNRDPSPTDRFKLMGLMDAVPVNGENVLNKALITPVLN